MACLLYTSPDVEVENPSLAPAVSASIDGVAVPARDVSFLGAIAGSPEHEAWAYGFTSAPPAEVKGSPLPYEAQGEQLVLLRYTDKGGLRFRIEGHIHPKVFDQKNKEMLLRCLLYTSRCV